jgi:replication factor A2
MSRGGFDADDRMPDDDVRHVVNERDAVVPATVKQVLEAVGNKDRDGDTFIDGRARKLVSLVAVVLASEEDGPALVYTLSDGSGSVKAQHFAATDDSLPEAFPVHSYVHVVGRLVGPDEPQVSAFSVKPIKDFKQIPFHYLQALHVHLVATRGASARRTEAEPARGAPRAGTGEDVEQAVLGVLRRGNRQNGMHKRDIVKQLAERFQVQQIDDAIDSLRYASEIYPGEDDRWVPVQ